MRRGSLEFTAQTPHNRGLGCTDVYCQFIVRQLGRNGKLYSLSTPSFIGTRGRWQFANLRLD